MEVRGGVVEKVGSGEGDGGKLIWWIGTKDVVGAARAVVGGEVVLGGCRRILASRTENLEGWEPTVLKMRPLPWQPSELLGMTSVAPSDDGNVSSSASNLPSHWSGRPPAEDLWLLHPRRWLLVTPLSPASPIPGWYGRYCAGCIGGKLGAGAWWLVAWKMVQAPWLPERRGRYVNKGQGAISLLLLAYLADCKSPTYIGLWPTEIS
jgi:hypothetical protein